MEKKKNTLRGPELKRLIVKTKFAIVATEMTIEKLSKEAQALVPVASEKKKAGDRRAAVQFMFKRRIKLRQIEKYAIAKKKLCEVRDQLVSAGNNTELGRTAKGARGAGVVDSRPRTPGRVPLRGQERRSSPQQQKTGAREQETGHSPHKGRMRSSL